METLALFGQFLGGIGILLLGIGVLLFAVNKYYQRSSPSKVLKQFATS